MAVLCWAALSLFVSPSILYAEYNVTKISDDEKIARAPVISSSGLIAWYAFDITDTGNASSDIYIYENKTLKNLTESVFKIGTANIKPVVSQNTVVWEAALQSPAKADVTWIFREVPQETNALQELDAGYQIPDALSTRDAIYGITTFAPPVTNAADSNTTSATVGRNPSGNNEICMWEAGNEVKRLTRDTRNDFAPDVSSGLVAWQKAKGWPFGWEIMVLEGDFRNQLTTNYYYDMGPKSDGKHVVWYGWDGEDFEIYLYNQEDKSIVQITTNQYDDVAPVIHNGVIAWEGYSAVEGDIYMWTAAEGIRKLSINIEDDVNPRVWNGQVVWQGFDGDDFEIYHFNGEKTLKLTSNVFDDLQPDINDGVICWMGYHDNWDAEIFVLDQPGGAPQMISDNEYEDRGPRTAGGRIVWQSDQDGKSIIYLAEPQ
ncbi:MAG: hypothetical protein EOM20_19195 [Spartobacteria bacterium]|nr:hypothetical protein [Spartobacteria bacterium]